jgi:DNA-binding MarR family transcriptional regulator
MFGEAAWDMLLELYVRENAGTTSTSAQLVAASGTPGSTAGRWLEHLAKEALVMRRRHPLDPGTEFIELSEKGREALDRYLSAIQVV